MNQYIPADSIELYDKSGNMLCYLEEAENVIGELEINGPSTLSFILPRNSYKWKYVDGQNIIRVKNLGGRNRYYLITHIGSKKDKEGQLISNITCEERYIELIEHPLESYDKTNILASTALTDILVGTGWKVGLVEVSGRRTLRVKNKNVLYGTNQINEIWGGVLDFNTENKVVNLRKPENFGRDRGAIIRPDYNLEEIEIDEDFSNIITRIKPKGKDGLTISSVNGGVDYVENLTYVKAAGYPVWKQVRTWIWEDNRYENAQALKDATLIKLEELHKPKVSYAAKVVNMARLTPEESHNDFMYGDWVQIIYPDLEINLNAQVVKSKIYPFEPWKDEVEIANFRNTERRRQAKIADAVERANTTIHPGGGIQFPDTPPPIPTNVQASGAFKKVILTWNEVNDPNLSAFEVFASTQSGFTPDHTNLVFKGRATVFTYDADVNSTYYFRVRSVGLGGGVSDFSSEVSASTVHIVTEDLIDQAINSVKLALQAVGEENLQDLAVSSAKIKDAAIISAKIGELAVGTAQLSNAAVTNAKIANLAVDDAKIADLSVTKLKAGSIDTAKHTIRGPNGRVEIDGDSLKILGGSLEVYSTPNASDSGIMIRGNRISTNFVKNSEFLTQPNETTDWAMYSGVKYDATGKKILIDCSTTMTFIGINQYFDVHHPKATFQALFKTNLIGGSTPKTVRIVIYNYDVNGTQLPSSIKTETFSAYQEKLLLTMPVIFPAGTVRCRLWVQVELDYNISNGMEIHWVKGSYDDVVSQDQLKMYPKDVYNLDANPETQMFSVTINVGINLQANTIYNIGRINFDKPFSPIGSTGRIICLLQPHSSNSNAYQAVSFGMDVSGFTLSITTNRAISNGSVLTIHGLAYRVDYYASITKSI